MCLGHEKHPRNKEEDAMQPLAGLGISLAVGFGRAGSGSHRGRRAHLESSDHNVARAVDGRNDTGNS
jgi:hypothetical protein